MSDLQKSFAKQKLASLPMNPPGPIVEDEEEENDQIAPLPVPASSNTDDESSSASSASSVGSAGTIRPNSKQNRSMRSGAAELMLSRNYSSDPYSPIPWHSFYTKTLKLSWAHSAFIYHAYYSPPVTSSAPLFVLAHGAGCSGLSFAACVAHLKALAPDIGILAPDFRGHGETEFRPEFGDEELVDGQLNMSLERLADDLEAIIDLLKKESEWEQMPNIVLIGHSLGGAVVTEVAARGKYGRRMLAFAVLDVVEGSAVDALKSMNAYLASRPQTFPSLEAGIEWHVRSRTIRNADSARISVPSYLKALSPTTGEPIGYTWSTDLTYTSPYWNDWFGGMSSKFLEARGGKLLLLAGTDRLDKELMIGHMQGKYQLQVFPEAGHFVQEDVPEKTARLLIEFWKRNDGGLLVLPPKVGTTGVNTGGKTA